MKKKNKKYIIHHNIAYSTYVYTFGLRYVLRKIELTRGYTDQRRLLGASVIFDKSLIIYYVLCHR